MIQKIGHADLPLHGGLVPKWLADRMKVLGTQIIESILIQYGRKEVLRRLSDPLWFQSLGAVLGMDWHSSGITTSVMYALKRGLNERARDFGIAVCGGRGKYSKETPDQLLWVADHTGLDGDSLVRSSKLAAKVDNTAVQDGFGLYLHNFVVSVDGDWAIVQQGMNAQTKTARRYHWCSENLEKFGDRSDSYLIEPHSGVTGENRGQILNLTDTDAQGTRKGILEISRENPDKVMKEIKLMVEKDVVLGTEVQYVTENGDRNLIMPRHHEVKAEDVNLKRLGAVLATSWDSQPQDFESLLLTPGLGPRTLQSLTLVSEVINGTPSRFKDPARFSFAHGGKDGHPFPVPLHIYDESIRILGDAIEKSRLGYKDKSDCIRRLHATALEIEKHCEPEADFDKVLEHEWLNTKAWGGRMEGE